MDTHTLRLWIPVFLLLVGPTFLAAEDSLQGKRILDVGNRNQLFIDSLFFDQSTNITLHLHPATKTGERNLVSDRPWEDATLNWFSVLEEGDRFRMWYECYDIQGWPTSDDTSFCYAESNDGIHWKKPSLGIFAYNGSTENNILFRQVGPEGAHSRVHGAGVFLDPNAPPEARYKAVSQGQFSQSDPPYRIAGMSSPDGLHWTRAPKPICDVFADSQYSSFWDGRIGQYSLYGRVSGRGRAIGRSTSSDFEHFEPLELVLKTDDQDPPDTDLYNPSAIQYPFAENVYLMFPSFYRHGEDTLDIHLAVSRDGIHWSWPERGKPFIPLGAAGSFDSGSLYLGQGIVGNGSELWQYYSGSPLKHNEVELDTLARPENQRVISRVVSRMDGFVSADAGEPQGEFTTPLLNVSGQKLLLNVRTFEEGEVRVGLLDGSGASIPGFTIEDCHPITGDNLKATVHWNAGELKQDIAGKPLRLKVQMRKASLFAFRFSS